MATDRVTWLGHATVLLELGGARLVTDPVLRPRVAHLVREAPVPDELGRLDAILDLARPPRPPRPAERCAGSIRRRPCSRRPTRLGAAPRAHAVRTL